MTKINSRNWNIFVGSKPEENSKVRVGIQQFRAPFSAKQQKAHFDLAVEMHETKAYNGRKLKKNTLMADPKGTNHQKKGWLGYRYPHHSAMTKLKDLETDGEIEEILPFISWEVDSVESITPIREIIDGLKAAGVMRPGMGCRFQVGFNVYDIAIGADGNSVLNQSGKIGGIGFHTDENFDDDDILVYVPGGPGADAIMTLHPHSQFGDHSLFSYQVPKGTVTRFQGLFRNIFFCLFTRLFW